MPALVAHYLFSLRVMNKLKKAGAGPADRDAMLIGAQGPDLFFFHRIMPWQAGCSYVSAGQQMHRISPARLFDELRRSLLEHAAGKPDRHMLGYIEGFICHYALDRMTHPYIYEAQLRLEEDDPGYGGPGAHKDVTKQYHFRIESALDTMTLRRETGRLIGDFSLPSVLPAADKECRMAIGRLYQPVMRRLFGIVGQPAELARAAGDMRQVLRLINDRRLRRQRLVHPLETLAGKGHILTSLLRPARTDDWDYANLEHRLWRNPFNEAYTSRDSFFDLFDLAANEAADMTVEFIESLETLRPMADITQDRGFYSDLPGVYE